MAVPPIRGRRPGRPPHPASMTTLKQRLARVVPFFRDNSRMLFGDARERVEDILRAL